MNQVLHEYIALQEQIQHILTTFSRDVAWRIIESVIEDAQRQEQQRELREQAIEEIVSQNNQF